MKQKPNWENAPKWANYLVMNEDGTWDWYEAKPEPIIHNGNWIDWTGKKYQSAEGYVFLWDFTLEERPQ